MWNIVGGFIVAILILFIPWIKKKLKFRVFRQVFGNDIDDFYIVYPSYESPSKDTTFQKPPSKVPRPSVRTINLTTINSNAATRSVSHLSYAIGNYSTSLPHIRSDREHYQFVNGFLMH